MDTKPKSREWVKTAAIIFLSIMLVLTFFSNTILNRTLTEVATSEITSGTITAKIRGTGTVTAIGNTEIKSTGTTTVASVKVKAGQEVSADDILFVMGEQSEELEEATEELESLEFQLMRAQNSYPVNTSSISVQYAEQEMLDAADNLARASAKRSEDEEYMKACEEVYAIENEIKQLQSDYDLATSIISSDEAAVSSANELYSLAENAYYNDPTEPKKKNMDDASDSLKKAQDKLDNDNSTYGPTISEYKALESKLTNKTEIRDSILSTLNSDYLNAQSRYSAAETALNAAYEAEATSYASNAQSSSTNSINILELQNKIKRQEEKIAKLQGGEDNAIKAPISGTVTSVEVSSGSSVAKGDVLCIIEVPDMGYTVSFSVTNEQAKRLKIGDSATVSNFYWGSEILATVSSIKVDPKNPQTSKLITFDIDGNVSSGSELTIAVGQKSASYDLILPASAVRTDSNGTYVLRLESKNSALGNRYFVQRVSVEVLATDDVSSAVSGDLSTGDFVVTTSSAPIKSGEQVRMADTNG